jgi:hypothetical protein
VQKEWFEYEFKELRIFERELRRLCRNEDEENEVKVFVAKHRTRGARLNSLGIRKIRVPLRGKGTRGGARIIYYYCDEKCTFIFFLLIYSKADKEDLAPGELEMLTRIVQQELEPEEPT